MDKLNMKQWDPETGTSGPCHDVDIATPEEIERMLMEVFTAAGVEEAIIHGVWVPSAVRTECYRKVMLGLAQKIARDPELHQKLSSGVFREYKNMETTC